MKMKTVGSFLSLRHMKWVCIFYLLFFFQLCSGGTTIVQKDSPPESQWAEVAMDSSGKVQYVLSYQYSLFSSLDYGASWAITNEDLRGGISVACDTSGQLLMVGTVFGIMISDDYGRTVARVESVPVGRYASVAYSGNGQYLVGAQLGGGLYMSSDFGETWALRLPAPTNSFWRSVAINENGNYIFAVPSLGDLYRSADAGVTWTNNTISAKDWTDIDVDDSGQFIIASSVYGLVQSLDGGVTWDELGSYDLIIDSVAISGNGLCIVGGSSNEPLIFSKNQGKAWVALNVPSTAWSDVAISVDGTYISAAVDNGGLFLTTNEGSDWSVHIATCEAASGYSDGDCRSCNSITSPEGYYVNDGSDLYCTSCPDFTVSFDSQTCSNPCAFPYIPSDNYFTTSVDDQCTQINFQVSMYIIAVIIVGSLALYILNLVILFVHISKLGENHRLALLVVVCTALPCLEFLANILYFFTSTLYSDYVLISLGVFLIHPVLFIAKDFWYKRTERHMQVRIIGESLLTTPVWEWLQYHRLVADEFASFLLANVCFGLITLCNILWMIPMLLLLFVLYATKLYAFASFARKWHGWWSGYYETSIPMVISWTNGQRGDYVIDIHFFHEQSVYAVFCGAIPLFATQMYNAWQLQDFTAVLFVALLFSALSIVNILYRAVYYKMWLSASLKDIPQLLHALNEANNEDGDDGTSPIRKSVVGGRENLRFSALQQESEHGPNTTLSVSRPDKDNTYTSVYQRRQFRHRQMALRREHIHATMKQADITWERRMRQARMTIQRRLNQIQTIVSQQQYRSNESSQYMSALDQLIASSKKGDRGGEIDMDLLQPRPSFSSLQQRGSESVVSESISMSHKHQLNTNNYHNNNNATTSILPSVDIEDSQNVDLLVRDIERTLRTLDVELAQFLSEEIESKLMSLALEIRRKSSMIPATASERGSFS